MAIYIQLPWLSFSVDVSKVHSYFKTNLSSNYDGLLCDTEKALVIFKADYEDADNTVVQAYWSSLIPTSFDPTPAEIMERGLDERIAWGANVVKQFRLYSMGITDEQGIQLLSNLMDVKMTLDLGMLAASAGLLASKDPDSVLDAAYDETQTVREYFIDMIMNKGPTP